MKKIALALNQENELDHFGHCDHFAIYEVNEENNVANETVVVNPEHRPGFLPKFLYDQGVNVVVAENLGAKAKQILDAFKMEVVFGVAGKKEMIIDKLLTTGLQSSDKCCEKHHDHDHHHEHGSEEHHHEHEHQDHHHKHHHHE
ncbi:MAG: NifB/NifX family molybdenum-iron cluster-binding protein [Candidatus Izemoplasmatales bacterium]